MQKRNREEEQQQGAIDVHESCDTKPVTISLPHRDDSDSEQEGTADCMSMTGINSTENLQGRNATKAESADYEQIQTLATEKAHHDERGEKKVGQQLLVNTYVVLLYVMVYGILSFTEKQQLYENTHNYISRI
jgi:hypothetical protein